MLYPQPMTSQTLSPASPGYIDPSDIDRRGLIGVGELSTPRWTSGDWQRHSRVPSLPQQGVSPYMPTAPGLTQVESAHNWTTGELGLGLGVGMMEQVPEEAAARDARIRHQSISNSPQKPPVTSRVSQTQPSTASNPDLDFATLLGSLDDFHFDSSMEAALAASLAIPDERPNTGTSASAVTSPISPQGFKPGSLLPAQVTSQPPNASNTGSPGSARSRIYARRAERESTRDRVQAEQPSIPLPVQSPPHSADSASFRRDSRKSPPAKDKDIRHHQSPSHDILKHFAPKDFSHLPPSPSSASINQFLRGSMSTHNFATNGLATGSTPPGMSPSASYFGAPAPIREGRDVRGSLPVSEMHKANASAWSREVDADTAEALRKLDGLGNTPGKSSRTKSSKTSTGLSSSSRPATPPKKTSSAHERKLNTKASFGSSKVEGENESPLNNWLDLGEDTQTTVPSSTTMRKYSAGNVQNGQEKRESSSSTSVAGTPNSRDSHSLPTSTTTPSSTLGTKIPGRRGSDGSVASQEATVDKSMGEASVPPVPPLPKGYMSMQQGLSAASYVPVHDASTSQDPTLVSPGPGSTADRPKPMSKKWSFSSALNLKLGKESPTLATSPSAQEAIDDSRSPEAPWSEIQKSELPSPYERRPSGQLSLNDNRSNTSLTPVASGVSQPQPPPLVKTTSGSKRLGPSSIPFFRRTSSSSSNQKAPAITEPPKSAGIQPSYSAQQGSSARKTGWGGLHLPSMLRGSASKRGLSQQALPPVETEGRPESGSIGNAGSTGWTGRQRGKTLSMSAEQAQAIMMPPPGALNSAIKPKASVESTLGSRDSAQSNRSESTINGGTARAPKTTLPAIQGSPALKTAPSSSSLRNDSRPHPSATPTKIPRIVSRQAEPGGSMPPPTTSSMATGSRTANWSARHMSNAASMNELARASITEFGTMAPRQPSSGSHRAHLLQPMSTREVTRTKVLRTTDPPMRRADGSLVPPSRRTLPNPPAAAAATTSSIAKRSSREFRPAGSRRESKETTDSGDKDSRDTSPIKPSKSLHSKLNLPSTAPVNRISPSSSVGAAGLNGSDFRKASLKQQPDSGTSSPADDEEALADNEMQAYVKRRRVRAASSRKDDMADVTAFPEDTEPVIPTPQRSFIKQRLATMSDYERKEVLDYDKIYCAPTRPITRPVGSGGTFNHGFDDERGDYLVVEGDHMCYRYEVGPILGKGSFGQVVQAKDHKTGQSVAIKIIRNKKRFHTQALVEVKILQQLCEWVSVPC